jgi:hypothetical protein
LTPTSDDGIVVEGSREDVDVDAGTVPIKLRERLGPEATVGFLHVLDVAQHDWRDDVLSLAGERFERRLAEVGSSVAVQIAQSEAALRHEMCQVEVRLRGELGHVDGRLREDLSQMELRIIREIGNSRFDLLKWTFAFWIGQVVAMSAIMAAMLRIVR